MSDASARLYSSNFGSENPFIPYLYLLQCTNQSFHMFVMLEPQFSLTYDDVLNRKFSYIFHLKIWHVKANDLETKGGLIFFIFNMHLFLKYNHTYIHICHFLMYPDFF